MVDFNQQPEKQPEPAGGLGGEIRPTRGSRDTRLIERALREQWDIPDQYRPGIVNRQVKIAIDPDSSPREATSAARCIVSMIGQNIEVALKALDKSVPDLHAFEGVIEKRDSVAELLTNPDYVEWLRERERDSKPGLICKNGHEGNGGPLANGHARNGH